MRLSIIFYGALSHGFTDQKMPCFLPVRVIREIAV